MAPRSCSETVSVLSSPLRRLPFGAVAVLLAATACSSGDLDSAVSARDPGYVECVVPRPQRCTRELLPVCALRDTGVRCVTAPCPSWERKTFSNACTACADPGVYGWQPGACEEEGVIEDR